MKSIPESHADILEKPAFAHLSTLMSDGSPHSAPVWVDTDEGYVVINSAEGRLKDRNIRRDPRVAISLTDPENPYRSLTIRGRVVKITSEGADAHIDRMAKKYMGVDSYPYRKPAEIRVLYYVEPEKVSVTP
ncbi:MAG: PPOX class F420-dependent oxidoreductase [Myxococcales bacterium]|nr:PPOX class F420-dependent oxidoreductase [Myxococcales bacterium]MDH3845076.1 PPOX class F420-dependent oxidoreductase [Myxococcales bacterium]